MFVFTYQFDYNCLSYSNPLRSGLSGYLHLVSVIPNRRKVKGALKREKICPNKLPALRIDYNCKVMLLNIAFTSENPTTRIAMLLCASESCRFVHFLR